MKHPLTTAAPPPLSLNRACATQPVVLTRLRPLALTRPLARSYGVRSAVRDPSAEKSNAEKGPARFNDNAHSGDPAVIAYRVATAFVLPPKNLSALADGKQCGRLLVQTCSSSSVEMFHPRKFGDDTRAFPSQTFMLQNGSGR